VFGIELSAIVVWLLIVAGLRTVGDVIVDGVVAVVHPDREAPSAARRRARAEITRKQAAARVETSRMNADAGIPPSPGQAAADRLAMWIANPPPWPHWLVAALSYLGLLIADKLANLRASHIERQRAKEDGRARRPHLGPFCWRCTVNRVAHDGDLCAGCAQIVVARCTTCRKHRPVADLDNGQCPSCREPAAPADEPEPGDYADSHTRGDPDGAVHLVVPALPAWLSEPTSPGTGHGPGQHHQHFQRHNGGTL
jgi:hypothetical protein